MIYVHSLGFHQRNRGISPMGEEILKQWTAAGGEVGPSRSSDAKSMPKYALFGPFWLIKITIPPIWVWINTY